MMTSLRHVIQQEILSNLVLEWKSLTTISSNHYACCIILNPQTQSRKEKASGITVDHNGPFKHYPCPWGHCDFLPSLKSQCTPTADSFARLQHNRTLQEWALICNKLQHSEDLTWLLHLPLQFKSTYCLI